MYRIVGYEGRKEQARGLPLAGTLWPNRESNRISLADAYSWETYGRLHRFRCTPSITGGRGILHPSEKGSSSIFIDVKRRRKRRTILYPFSLFVTFATPFRSLVLRFSSRSIFCPCSLVPGLFYSTGVPVSMFAFQRTEFDRIATPSSFPRSLFLVTRQPFSFLREKSVSTLMERQGCKVAVFRAEFDETVIVLSHYQTS